MPRLEVNGIHLNITEQGQGRPLVMLHGLGQNSASMEREIQELSRSFRVVAVDSRGHGRSDRPARYTLNDHVQDVLSVLDILGLASTYLMGTSMGSYIAQGVAAAAPKRVDRLVLIVPKASGVTSSTERYLAEHAEEVRGLNADELRMFMAGRMFAPETPPETRQGMYDLLAEQQRSGLALTAEQSQAAATALEGFDFRPELPHLTMPTLVISGRHDVLNPPFEGEEIVRLMPDARQVVLEHSGHLASFEEPDELLLVVEAFLKA